MTELEFLHNELARCLMHLTARQFRSAKRSFLSIEQSGFNYFPMSYIPVACVRFGTWVLVPLQGAGGKYLLPIWYCPQRSESLSSLQTTNFKTQVQRDVAIARLESSPAALANDKLVTLQTVGDGTTKVSWAQVVHPTSSFPDGCKCRTDWTKCFTTRSLTRNLFRL